MGRKKGTTKKISHQIEIIDEHPKENVPGTCINGHKYVKVRIHGKESVACISINQLENIKNNQ